MFTFAIPNNCNIPSIKAIVRKVKTKAWVKLHNKYMDRWQDRLTTAGQDSRMSIGGMLHAAYGVNIGEQVLSLLDNSDLETIRYNIIY